MARESHPYELNYNSPDGGNLAQAFTDDKTAQRTVITIGRQTRPDEAPGYQLHVRSTVGSVVKKDVTLTIGVEHSGFSDNGTSGPLVMTDELKDLARTIAKQFPTQEALDNASEDTVFGTIDRITKDGDELRAAAIRAMTANGTLINPITPADQAAFVPAVVTRPPNQTEITAGQTH